jgi:hypothetical protein
MADWRLTVSANGPGSESIRDLVEPYLDDERCASSGPTS